MATAGSRATARRRLHGVAAQLCAGFPAANLDPRIVAHNKAQMACAYIRLHFTVYSSRNSPPSQRTQVMANGCLPSGRLIKEMAPPEILKRMMKGAPAKTRVSAITSKL
jgi:hypothetical protein